MSLRHTLLEAKTSLHLACAGAGLAFLDQLWSAPGSSAYLSGASLLQSRRELDRFMGTEPDEGYCSKESAFELATAAYLRAAQAAHEDDAAKLPIGFALTASIATNRMPRGDQRAHIAIVTSQGLAYQKVALQKREGAEARREHDRILAQACRDQLLQAIKKPEVASPNEDYALQRLARRPFFLPSGLRLAELPEAKLFFPANFNPLHDGHRLAARQAEQAAGRRAHFMIEVRPPNKPPIPLPEVLRRIALLLRDSERAQTLDRAVAITIGRPNYLDKARAFPGCGFVAGADAAQRLLDPSWGYEVEPQLRELDQLGARFYIMGRQCGETFVSLQDLPIPKAYRHLFHHLEGSHPASSSQLRGEG